MDTSTSATLKTTLVTTVAVQCIQNMVPGVDRSKRNAEIASNLNAVNSPEVTGSALDLVNSKETSAIDGFYAVAKITKALDTGLVASAMKLCENTAFKSINEGGAVFGGMLYGLHQKMSEYSGDNKKLAEALTGLNDASSAAWALASLSYKVLPGAHLPTLDKTKLFSSFINVAPSMNSGYALKCLVKLIDIFVKA